MACGVMSWPVLQIYVIWGLMSKKFFLWDVGDGVRCGGGVVGWGVELGCISMKKSCVNIW